MNEDLRKITLKRVPVGLDWNGIWFGYLMHDILCECCVGIGSVNWEPDEVGQDFLQTRVCPVCEGKGKVIPIIELPTGKGFQIWETMNYFTGKDEHHYYPLSPVFKDAYDLAAWMSKNIIINDDPLLSEATWHEAITDGNVDVVYGLYKDQIKFSSALYF